MLILISLCAIIACLLLIAWQIGSVSSQIGLLPKSASVNVTVQPAAVVVPEPSVSVTVQPAVASPQPTQPHVIVKIIPLSEFAPAIPILPGAGREVKIVKLKDGGSTELIGVREIGHPDVQAALDEKGLAVEWPSGDLDVGNQG